MNIRIYVEKKPEFKVEEKSLVNELNLNLGLSLENVRCLNIYDIFNISEELLEKAKYSVFGEVQTDLVYDSFDYNEYTPLAIELLPGQFDQRAKAAESLIKLIEPSSDVRITSAKLYLFPLNTALEGVESYLINKVESRKKDLSKLEEFPYSTPDKPVILEGFRNITNYDEYAENNSLAMNGDDLKCVVEYFKEEGRDPYLVELKILDTYWSDHCRHTTFNTILDNVTFLEGDLHDSLVESYNLYLSLRKDLNREHKKLCLMDLACIGAMALRKQGYLDDQEISEENNACSIIVEINNEDWLIQFKNETHNHPTEIEPFGGASTCLGGAIRDPLSGRSYVYQAMRITGAGNIYEEVKDTLPNKLPQRIISTKAAHGYSSYGNQIGLSCAHVREIYHPNYVAKRLEVGAVVGASLKENVRRESPVPGDKIILLGGLTGRDGIGGATGSSKKHNEASLTTCGSEVQKGNAIEERKIQRLFRRPDCSILIKKSNDFGAGGVSVAIGELADGLVINLDLVPVKYQGLGEIELAISESQERMAVVVSESDVEKFISICHEENILATCVASVTDKARLQMYYKDELVVDITREFIDSAGAIHRTNCTVDTDIHNYPNYKNSGNLKHDVCRILSSENVLTQKGLCEMFDSTIGRSTVLLPYGGKYQRTETQVSANLIPTDTSLATILSYGYDPFLSEANPYLGGMYSIIESLAKLVACGCDYKNTKFSFQEYFKRMTDDKAYGLPLSALLGALKLQNEFKLASIGGKDSMSGTYLDINVPPMLMSIALNVCDSKYMVSPEFKNIGNYIYLVKHHELDKHLPNIEELKANFTSIYENIVAKKIVSGFALTKGGICEALFKMAFGNMIGFNVEVNLDDLGRLDYGSIIVEASEVINHDNYILLGMSSDKVLINNQEFNLEEMYYMNKDRFNTIYKEDVESLSPIKEYDTYKSNKKFSNYIEGKVKVLVPVFPGTNCDYDTANAFSELGCEIKYFVFNNLTDKDVINSNKEFARLIDETNILVFSGGFSAADEPDGSGKFISNIINNELVKASINRLLERKCLVLGICNGFQALIKSGLLPFGKIGEVNENSATLFRNDINRHISKIVSTKIMTNNSPWLQSYSTGEIESIAVSHGEGKFVCNPEIFETLLKNGQIAFAYTDTYGNVTTLSPYNPNGSYYGIEGIVSPCGLVLGKMGHSERYRDNCYKNIWGNKEQQIFINAVKYFKEQK